MVFLAPVTTFAHGDRPSFEAETGPYLIDIGYDVLGFRPGEQVTFDFDLFRDPNGVPSFEPFDHVRVEVAKDGEVVHSQEIENQQTLVPSMKYAFPAAGAYTLSAGYVRDGTLIAEASFAIAVSAGSGTAQRTEAILTYIVAAALVLFCGGYTAWSWVRSRRKT